MKFEFKKIEITVIRLLAEPSTSAPASAPVLWPSQELKLVDSIYLIFVFHEINLGFKFSFQNIREPI